MAKGVKAGAVQTVSPGQGEKDGAGRADADAKGRPTDEIDR